MGLDINRLSTIARIWRFRVTETRRNLDIQLNAERQTELQLEQIAKQTSRELELARQCEAHDPNKQLFLAWICLNSKKFEEARSLCKTASEGVAIARQAVAHAMGELNVIEELVRSVEGSIAAEVDKKALMALIDMVSSGIIKLN